MLTRRGWAMAVAGLILVGLGLINWLDGFAYLGFCLLAWLGLNWLRMRFATASMAADLQLIRTVRDRGGVCRTLRDGQSLTITCSVLNRGRFTLPLARLEDRPPADMTWVDRPERKAGWFSPRVAREQWPAADGAIPPGGRLELVWRGRLESPGVARFEGARLTVLDPQGLVGRSLFIRSPVEMLVLPDPGPVEDPSGGGKRANHLLPPGHHRLRRPGGSSEILDVRDYVPGDSPRHIAWKLSARRDRIIVRDFESEVPIRCQLVVDGTRPLRKWHPGGARLANLSTAAAGVLEHCLEQRDPVGLVVAEEARVIIRQPAAGSRHRLRVLQTLAESCASPGVFPPREEDPLVLFPQALRVAREVYPDIARSSWASMPWRWILWGPPRPGFSRYGGLGGWIYRHRVYTWLVPPILMVTSYVVASGWMCLAVPLSGPGLWLAVRIASFFPQWQLRDRKVLATVLVAREGGGPGHLDALLEDDTLLATSLRAFLADHREDRNLAAPPPAALRVQSKARAERLALGLLSAVSRARDPELHVLFSDTEDLAARLDRLERAVRVSRSRRHEVMVVLAPKTVREQVPDAPVENGSWFRRSIPRVAGLWINRKFGLRKFKDPGAKEGGPPNAEGNALNPAEGQALAELRRRLGRLGVPVVVGKDCAAEAQRLVARLRRSGARVGPR
ncbi:MAG: DUF58 domain-containing protein [Gemmataceae bacterium]|nr:DUF58 domain-containing protein [Gemmataceae bacterium]